MYSDEPIDGIARECVASFTKAGLTASAKVRESRTAIDLALLEGAPTVVRCAEKATQDDVEALRVMLAQGDFDRAFLVYTAEDQPPLSGEIEAYPLSRIDELAASLARESDP